MPIVHADVADSTLEYLEEWADAVGCEVHEVAGDAIELAVRKEEGDAE